MKRKAENRGGVLRSRLMQGGVLALAGTFLLSSPAFGLRGESAPERNAARAETTAGNNFVESYSPTGLENVPLNQKIQVIFAESQEADDAIDPRTVNLEIDDTPADINGYYIEPRGNREFRYVPFPFWEAGTLYHIEIPAGVTYQRTGATMTEPLVWSFMTQSQGVDEDYNYFTQPLSAEELEAAQAGSADRFLDGNLVKDYLDANSALYQISLSADPTEPEVVALGEKMVNSLMSLGAIGLAAPQLGINRRIFAAQVEGQKIVFINPRVMSYSEEIYYGSKEGCLSIEYVKAKVGRPSWITVEYDTPGGGHVSDELHQKDDAKVWLHEYDHLNGILMTDRQEDKLFASPQPSREAGQWVPIDPGEL